MLLLAVSPSVEEDRTPILCPCGSNGSECLINPLLLLFYLCCALVLVAHSTSSLTWTHIGNGMHHFFPLLIVENVEREIALNYGACNHYVGNFLALSKESN